MSSRHKPMGPLARWGRFAANHPWRVISGWLIAIAILAVLSNAFGANYTSVFSIPNSESQSAIELLNERFPEASGDTATIVFHARNGSITDPAIQQEIQAVLQQAAQLPDVVAVVGPDQNPMQIAPDGTIAYASLLYSVQAIDVSPDSVEALMNLVTSSNSDSLQVEAGGQIASMGEVPELGSSEIVGIALAMIIMLVMFGSIIAMGLPIVTALIGVGISMLILPLMANWFTFHNMIVNAFLTMMGLGVGIDYALFILNRFRENLAHGDEVDDAVALATNTAGRSVAFAGVTVAIGLLGLSLVGIPFVTGLGITGSTVVIMSVLIALFLMPAILGLIGRRILALKIPFLGNTSNSKNSFWFRWGRNIQKQPGLIAGATIVILLALASPYLDMNLGLSDAGNNPESMTTRRAYDLMAQGFGPGSNGPLVIVVENDNGLNQDGLNQLVGALNQTDGVAAALPAVPNADGTTAIIQLIPTTGPQDTATEDLIHTLRDDVLPPVEQSDGVTAYVAGSTSANIDLSERIAERMPIFYAVVVGLSFLLLMMVFQSVLVPLKAALTTLLSVFASMGAVTAVFQWGWLQDLLGTSGTGPIESFLPMILFGVVFGLSMDYEVFLLSRVHEEHVHGTPAKPAMLDGVGYSGRVVAAAGAIMASVFLSFLLEDMRMLQMLGFGLGFAILIDAFVVRLILVPAIMTLLDEKAWWYPEWLRKVLPSLNVEGESTEYVDTSVTQPAD